MWLRSKSSAARLWRSGCHAYAIVGHGDCQRDIVRFGVYRDTPAHAALFQAMDKGVFHQRLHQQRQNKQLLAARFGGHGKLHGIAETVVLQL